jgi:ketosteroid isomerase-like protein
MIGALMFKLMAGSAMDSLNSRDIPKLMKPWAEDAVFVYGGTTSMSGTYHGKQAATEFFHKFFDQFPKVHFKCTGVFIKNIFALGAANTVAIQWENVLINKNGERFENGGMNVTKVNWKAKAVHVQDFYIDAEKQKRAWGE